MHSIHENAAKKLFEKVQLLENQPHESWRCVYLRMRTKLEQTKHEACVNFIRAPLVNLLASYKGNIYFCKDGDIFILLQGSTRIIALLLDQHFGNFDSHPFKDISEGSLFRLFEYDLNKNWTNFYTICENKFVEALAFEEELRQHKRLAEQALQANKPHQQQSVRKVPFFQIEKPGLRMAGEI